MVIKEKIITNIIMNEIHNLKKIRQIKDTVTVSTSQRRSANDKEYTHLLKNIVKQIEKKEKNTYKIQMKNKNESTRTKDIEVKCNVCKQFFSKTYFVIHMKMHDNALYKCDICHKNFSYLSILNRHKLVHSNNSLYKCKLCDKTFKYACSLSTHYTFHEWESIRKCRFCFKKFEEYNDYYDHIKMYTFNRPFLCSLCQKSFGTFQSLTNHLKIHNENNHISSCYICKRSFAERHTIIKYTK